MKHSFIMRLLSLGGGLLFCLCGIAACTSASNKCTADSQVGGEYSVAVSEVTGVLLAHPHIVAKFCIPGLCCEQGIDKDPAGQPACVDPSTCTTCSWSNGKLTIARIFGQQLFNQSGSYPAEVSVFDGAGFSSSKKVLMPITLAEGCVPFATGMAEVTFP
jgi:hypothetical protein